MTKKKKTSPNHIASNKRARHDYQLLQHFEAGIALEGWEVKSIRKGQVSLSESYIIFDKGEAYLYGAQFTPLINTCTHYKPEPLRNRKLLLNKKELAQIFRAINQKGQTCVPVGMYWKKCFVKLDIALAQGKKMYDKRQSTKTREWNIDKQRIQKHSFR